MCSSDLYLLASIDPGEDPDLLAILEDRDMTSATARAQGLVRMELLEASR